MEYQKIANLLDDNKSNQPSKFRTKNWVEINDESRGTYNVNSQIKFKTTMLKSSLLLDYPYFIETYKIIAVDLSKQKALDFDPKAIQQINFTGNLDRAENTRVYFILEEAKETALDFSQGIVKVI